MSDRCFLDTNILVYARDTAAARKQEIAAAIVNEAFDSGSYRTSRQVLHEFYVTVTRKLVPGLSSSEARAATEALEALEPCPLDTVLLREAWGVEDRHGLSFWDAMIVAAAQLSDCVTLYTEDLSHGSKYGTVRVVNPFA